MSVAINCVEHYFSFIYTLKTQFKVETSNILFTSTRLTVTILICVLS